MSGWKFVCAAEAAALVFVWWWLGRAPEADGAAFAQELPPSATRAEPEPEQRTAPEASGTLEPAPAAAAAEPAAAPHPPPPRADGLVTLMGSITDEQGSPILEPWVQIHHESGDVEQVSVGRGQSHFLLLDRAWGDYDVEIRAGGFVALRGPVRLRPEPAFQRQTFRLQRSWRVFVRVETEQGERLMDWLARTTAGAAREYRIMAAAVREAPSGDRAAMDHQVSSTDLGSFVPSGSDIPKEFDCALDLAAEPPLQAAAWLGSALLGSAPLRAGVDRVTIRVRTQDLAARLSTVTLRVVDQESGMPLPQAKVSLTPQWMSSGGKPVDSAGRILFELQVPGPMDLDVFCAGFGETFRSLILFPGQILDLGDVGMLPDGQLRGRVLDPQGAPVPQLMFQFFPTGSWTRPEEPRRSRSNTDAEGRISLQASAERHQIILGGGPYGLQAAVWERGRAEAEELEIRLQPGVRVRLSLQPPEQQERLLWLMDFAGRLLAPSFQSRYGDWQLSLTPGGYLLRVEDLDRNLLGTLDLRVPEGGGDLAVALP